MSKRSIGKKKGRLMLGGSPIQQTFDERDTSIGALDGATNDQKAAGEEAIKMRDDTNKQSGGFAKDFMPHPSMNPQQAGVQQGVTNTFQQGQANAEFDNLVPKANKCLKEQAGIFGGARRKSLFKKKRKKRRTKSLLKKKRTKSLLKKKRTKKRRRKRTKKWKGGRRRGRSKKKSTKKYFRFSQKPPEIL